MNIKNFFGHLRTVTKHKWEVFKLATRAGIPIRGLLHDMSKFTPTEFFESVKYYQGGIKSPIPVARDIKGYSSAWLHHKGRNKHHFEFWYDARAKEQPIIPFKYSLEMICDMVAAGITYKGKKWYSGYQLEYWNREEKGIIANEKMKNFCREVFTELKEKGVNQTITNKNIRRIYDKNCK